MNYRPKRCPNCKKISTVGNDLIRYCSEDGTRLIPVERREGMDRRSGDGENVEREQVEMKEAGEDD